MLGLGGALIVMGLLAAGALAGNGRPPADATPGDAGVSGAVLGAIAPVAAPGYRLQMTELVWQPGAYATSHTHPLAQVVCVQSGALGFLLEAGTATVIRGGTGPTPEATESLELNAEVVIEPRDCISYDDFAAYHVHTVWNASDAETVLWMADLVASGEPYTTYVNALGTPVP
jgi:predicted metal-dependent enzyme (double-stranded beta helix superfamily)